MNDHKWILKTELIIKSIEDSVKSGKLKLNSKMPSITQMSDEFNVANETVVKAYNKLKEQGIITSIRGKGFYVSKTNFSVKRNVFVLFDTLTAYKETLYGAMLDVLGNKAVLDIYFHHYNIRLFESLIKEAAGKYTDYVILPLYDKKVKSALKVIPKDQLYIIDCYMEDFPCRGVFQDFRNDVYNALSSVSFPKGKYTEFNFVYRGVCGYVVSGIITGIKEFCKEREIDFSINDGINCPVIKKSHAYLTIDDEFMVDMVLQARSLSLKLGSDIGMISYNDTALKKIAEGGISVISTDFAKMGHDIASMILNYSDDCIRNPVRFIDRGSF